MIADLHLNRQRWTHSGRDVNIECDVPMTQQPLQSCSFTKTAARAERLSEPEKDAKLSYAWSDCHSTPSAVHARCPETRPHALSRGQSSSGGHHVPGWLGRTRTPAPRAPPVCPMRCVTPRQSAGDQNRLHLVLGHGQTTSIKQSAARRSSVTARIHTLLHTDISTSKCYVGQTMGVSHRRKPSNLICMLDMLLTAAECFDYASGDTGTHLGDGLNALQHRADLALHVCTVQAV